MLGPGVRGFCVDTLGQREPQKVSEKGVWGQKWYLRKIVGIIECKAVFQEKEGLRRHVKRNSVPFPDSQMNLDFSDKWKALQPLSLFFVSKRGPLAPPACECFLLPGTKGPR